MNSSRSQIPPDYRQPQAAPSYQSRTASSSSMRYGYGQPLPPPPPPQVIYVERPKSNGVGITGFVFSIFGLFLGWIPIFGWIVWFVGALLSLIGVFMTPRSLSIAGLIISFIGLIITIFLAGMILTMLGLGSLL